MAGFFDHQYLWKESVNALDFWLSDTLQGRKHPRQQYFQRELINLLDFLDRNIGYEWNNKLEPNSRVWPALPNHIQFSWNWIWKMKMEWGRKWFRKWKLYKFYTQKYWLYHHNDHYQWDYWILWSLMSLDGIKRCLQILYT